jgi:hypothetical protein
MPLVQGAVPLLERFLDAIAATVEAPSMIGADQLFTVDRSERKRSTTMRAMIVEDGNAPTFVSPNREPLSKSLDTDWFFAELVRL